MNREKVLNIVYTIVVPLIQVISYGLLILFLVLEKTYSATASMVAIIACCFYILITPLIIKRKLHWNEIVEVVVSGTLSVTFTIIFVCGSPEAYRETLGTIAGSLMGGLFTLFGVGLTIKYNLYLRKKMTNKKQNHTSFQFLGILLKIFKRYKIGMFLLKDG